ncbi:hypothetical protein DYB37_006661 [Aphanomyces astaci]|uniref:Aldehyde dehydrogenase n=1 Tax=Aphanomyces astaci TaxID=112090 RepID=A0A3R6X8I8_APHAT|nr:hypothetical protein DYB37_006661 [Aphanomyces astaci]
MTIRSYGTMTTKSPLASEFESVPATVAPSTKESIQASLGTLRASFRQGKLRAVESRKRILRQIRTLVTEGTPLLEAAVMKDLHKHPTELHMMELSGVFQEIQEFLDYLDDWAAPEKVPTNLINFPGSSSIVSDPLGVCCIIGTWNYPVSLLLTPLVGCIGAGNTALLRLPADGTSDHTAAALAYLLDKYIDQDVVRYVAGGIDANIALLAEKFDLIFCTGGTSCTIFGLFLYPLYLDFVLELGGKSPCIVDAKVDIQVAATRVAWGAFANCGQTCIRPDYVFVHTSVADQFVSAVVANVQSFFGSSPETSDSYGRLVNAAQYARLSAVVEADKAFVACGGSGDASARYLAPTVLHFGHDVAAFEASAALTRGELFGPVLPIVAYTDLDAVIGFINALPKPLALYVFSNNDRDVVAPVLGQTSSGSVCVNDTMIQITNSHLPFGGVGPSGTGAYHGKHSFQTFSHHKAVVRKTTRFDLPQRYMPYTSASARIMKAAGTPITRTQTRLLVAAAVGAVAAIIAAIVWAAAVSD